MLQPCSIDLSGAKHPTYFFLKGALVQASCLLFTTGLVDHQVGSLKSFWVQRDQDIFLSFNWGKLANET